MCARNLNDSQLPSIHLPLFLHYECERKMIYIWVVYIGDRCFWCVTTTTAQKRIEKWKIIYIENYRLDEYERNEIRLRSSFFLQCVHFTKGAHFFNETITSWCIIINLQSTANVIILHHKFVCTSVRFTEWN